jgi:arginine transport system permease protein
MNFAQLISYFPQLLHSVLTTLVLMLGALLVGLSLAIVMTFVNMANSIYIRTPINAIIFFIRGTPLLVQIFLIYYGLGQFIWLRETPVWIILREPFACAIIAFAINTAGYTTVLFKGAIDSVPKGEFDACRALGMSKLLMLRRVIFPHAVRIVLPAYSNEVIMILQSTSLASTITILDLMGMTQQIIAQTYDTVPFLIMAGILYLLLNSIIIGLFRLMERRANRYLTI